MMLGDPRTDGSYVSMSLDALSWAQTSASVANLFTAQTQVSVDAWVRFNGLPANTVVIGQSGVFAFGSQGTSIYFQFADFPIVLSDLTVSKLQDDHWHYICTTFDGSMIRLYIDGKFNTGQSCMGQVAISQNPVMIGQGVQGLVKRVRIYNIVLDKETVLANMFGTPASDTLFADFDFSINPPIDRGSSAYPVSLQNNAFMVKVSPAVSLGTVGFIRPLDDNDINPGGRKVDPYSVQAWVFISSKLNPIQAIFVNSDLMLETGIALYLQYDTTVSAYRLVSQRGSVSINGQNLTSLNTISVGVWTNVATTFDGLNLNLYINGKLDNSMTCTPLSLYKQFGNLLIGATLEEGNPSGATTLQGFIREVDIWSRALNATEILNFMTTPPDVESEGLLGAYVFTNSPARNQVNGHPIALVEGAVLSGQLEPAPVTANKHISDSIEKPETELDPEIMAKIRAELDLNQFYKRNIKAFDAAQSADMAAFVDPAEKELIRKAWADVRNKIENDPDSLAFLVTDHKIDGERLLIVHRPSGSYVAYRTAENKFDECTFWKIKLVFTIIFGALDAFTGIYARLTDDAAAYILRILTNPEVTSVMALGSSMNAINIFLLLNKFYNLGVLRQLILLVIDVGFWTIVRVVANITLIALGVGSARIIASLVATAATFMYVYIHDKPNSCNSLPTVNLVSISFDYDPRRISVEALTIRRNFNSKIDVPEWTTSKKLPIDAPCAYALNVVSGKIPTIEVVLNISKPIPSPIVIQATGGGILGAIDPITVIFGSDNQSKVLLSLNNHKLADGGVQRTDVTWNWKYQIDGGAWADMATTQHRVYVILNEPQAPWEQNPDRNNQQLPWTDVLDYACDWAKGTKDVDDVLNMVTNKVNKDLNLIYDEPQGKPYYIREVSSPDPRSVFLCGDFIDFLNKNKSNGNKVNCSDCATIVTTFSNILGADAQEVKLGYGVGFYCNEILLIGTKTWKVPGFGGFSFHEVAGRMTQLTDLKDILLYDACLQYDTGTNPWGKGSHQAGLPIKVPFTSLGLMPNPFPVPIPFTASSYRERLATNDYKGIPCCIFMASIGSTNFGHRSIM
jgi:hypothetical protein